MISVVIPTFNNKEQLLKNLQKNSIFFGEREIIVVNDNPDINLQSDLKKFSNMRLIQNKKNLGFSGAADRGIRETESSHVLLLNDDVMLTDNTYQNALDYFKDKSTFAVSLSQKEKDGVLVGKNKLYWASGMLFHSKAKDSTNGLNAWAEGGACIIDKKKYEMLGGFDHLYNPFYWEDIDLSYQAWKKGYKVIFDPAVVFIHHHESTISQNFSPQFIKKIAYRNQFIFIWKNMEDANFLLQHIAFLPYNMLYYMLKGEVEFVAGFFAALKQLRTVLQKRNLSNKNRVVPDKDILKLFT